MASNMANTKQKRSGGEGNPPTEAPAVKQGAGGGVASKPKSRSDKEVVVQSGVLSPNAPTGFLPG